MAITEFSKNYHEKMFPGWFDRLKRIKDACDKAGCRVEFETLDDGFVVVFYRYGIQKLSGTAQKTLKKKKGSMRCLNIAMTIPDKPRSKNVCAYHCNHWHGIYGGFCICSDGTAASYRFIYPSCNSRIYRLDYSLFPL